MLKAFTSSVNTNDEASEGNRLFDSSATNDMTPDLESLSDVHEYSGMNNITIGNGLGLRISNVRSG